jgi:hypothetical protein
VTLALLLLPLGVWRLSARQSEGLADSGLAKCRAILRPWQFSESVKAGHPAPAASLDWLHASVTGVVPTLAERTSIHQAIDQLDGIQCHREGIAQLRVMPHLDAKRDGNRILLSGEVSLRETVAEAVRLIVQAEPGVEVDASAVTVHPAVLHVSLPQRVQDAGDHAFLAKTWQAVHFAWPVVSIDFEGRTPRLVGQFPLQKVRDQVVAALRAARPDLVLDEEAAALDSNLPPVDFAGPDGAEWVPPGWLKDTWDKWMVYPALRLRLERHEYRLDGLVPSTSILNTVLSVLHRLRPDLRFAKGDLKIRQGSLDRPVLLPASLKGWTPPTWLQPLVEQVSSLPVPSASPTSSF